METGQILRFALEVLVFAVVMYAFIRFLQETRGSAVLKGFMVLILVIGILLVSLVRVFHLDHLEYLADKGLYILLFALIVVFQPELRQALVRLGDSAFLQRLTRSTGIKHTVAEDIVQAVERMSKRGLGALIIIERSVGISGFAEHGIRIDSQVSAPLLVTIFWKDTPLHDGAVLIQGRRILAAACLLPLTENPNLALSLGTRHRAAIGATEENDALAIVVSEETRRISVASQGRLEEDVDPDRLREILLQGATQEEEVTV